VRLGKVSIAVKTFGVCDYSRLAVTDWRLRRWRLRRWRLRFLALVTATNFIKALNVMQVPFSGQYLHIHGPVLSQLFLVYFNTITRNFSHGNLLLARKC